MASGDVKMAVLGNIHMYIRVIEVSDFKSDFKFLLLSSLPCIVARSSKGPLPSGSNLCQIDCLVGNVELLRMFSYRLIAVKGPSRQ